MRILTLFILATLISCTNQALTEAQRSLGQYNYNRAINYLKMHLEDHSKDDEAHTVLISKSGWTLILRSGICYSLLL